MERIGREQPGFLSVIEAAIHAEDLVKQAHPDRHPGGDATALIRFLGDYLKQVEGAGELVAACADVYKDFARAIDEGRDKLYATDSDDDGDQCGGGDRDYTDAQLKNIYRRGEQAGWQGLLTVLSSSDKARLETLLYGDEPWSDEEEDSTSLKTAAHVAACGVAA